MINIDPWKIKEMAAVGSVISFTVGAGMIYTPLAFMVVGAALACIAKSMLTDNEGN